MGGSSRMSMLSGEAKGVDVGRIDADICAAVPGARTPATRAVFSARAARPDVAWDGEAKPAVYQVIPGQSFLDGAGPLR